MSFIVSRTAPASGFYLEQQNIQDGEAIFLTANVSTPTTVPLPDSLALFGAALIALLSLRRKVGL